MYLYWKARSFATCFVWHIACIYTVAYMFSWSMLMCLEQFVTTQSYLTGNKSNLSFKGATLRAPFKQTWVCRGWHHLRPFKRLWLGRLLSTVNTRRPAVTDAYIDLKPHRLRFPQLIRYNPLVFEEYDSNTQMALVWLSTLILTKKRIVKKVAYVYSFVDSRSTNVSFK